MKEGEIYIKPDSANYAIYIATVSKAYFLHLSDRILDQFRSQGDIFISSLLKIALLPKFLHTLPMEEGFLLSFSQ